MLHVEVPLLHVGPDGFIGQRDELQWSSAGSASSWKPIRARSSRLLYPAMLRMLVMGVVLLSYSKRFRIGLVAVGVLEEDSVAAANGPLAVALWIKGKSDARRGIEPFIFQAAGRNARRDAAVDPSIVGISNHQTGCGIDAAGAGDIERWDRNSRPDYFSRDRFRRSLDEDLDSV